MYLRENILERNYDAGEFITFLNNKLSIGDNLDLCTFDELKAVVNQFIQVKKQEEAEKFQPMVSMMQSVVEVEK